MSHPVIVLILCMESVTQSAASDDDLRASSGGLLYLESSIRSLPTYGRAYPITTTTTESLVWWIMIGHIQSVM